MIFSLLIAVLVAACGSQPVADGTAAKNGTAGAPAASPGSGQPSDPSAPSGIAVPSGNSNIDANSPPAGDVAMGNKRGIVDGPAGPPMAPPVKNAPENSTLATTMGKNGAFIETRVFTADPFVAKVEKTSLGPNQTAKIFLKNGRVVSVAADKIGAIGTVTLATIRELAGVKPAAPPPGETRPDDTKKKP